LRARPHASLHDDSPAHARPQDDAEHDAIAKGCRRSEPSLGQREAIRIVVEEDVPSEPDSELVAERATVQAHGVRVLDQAGPRDAARHPYPDRGDAGSEPCFALDRQHEGRGGLEDGLVPVLPRGRDSPADADCVVPTLGCRVEDDGLDLRPAEVHADGKLERHRVRA
jgi:hypothetical protein